MSLFEGQAAKERKSGFLSVLGVMLADGKIDKNEELFLASVAVRLGISEKELKEVLDDPSAVAFTPPKDSRERVCQLVDVVLMMLVDGEIDRREAELCIHAARRLGFPAETVTKLVEAIIERVKQGIDRADIGSEFSSML